MNTLQPFNRWIFASGPQPQTRVRLFCFSHAGGGASFFRSWTTLFPSEIEVCPMQLPGRENRLREPLFTHYDALIEALATELHPYMTVPFVFLGHSMGALLSYGVAHVLRKRYDLQPLHLFLSAYRAPQVNHLEPPLHQLPEQAFIAKILSMNGTSREVLENEELRRLLLPIMRADFSVCETFSYLRYSNQEPLDCPITVFGGEQDTRIGQKALVLWQEQTRGQFNVQMWPGGHFYLQELRESLAQYITRELRPYVSNSVTVQ